jgi:replicative DNA helicase
MNAHAREVLTALPDAVEAEQALLGAILVQNATYWTVAGFLKPMHFSEPLHQAIYETAGTMVAEGRAANPITMKPYLPTDGKVGSLTV